MTSRSTSRALVNVNGVVIEIRITVGEGGTAGALRTDQRPDAESLLPAWHAAIGSTPVTGRQLIARARASPDQSLKQRLDDLCLDSSGALNARTLGKILARLHGTVAHGFQLARYGRKDNVSSWRVVRTSA